MKPELSQLVSRVHELYRQALGESAQAREWLIEQGVESAELIERFQLGFASGDLKKILPKDERVEKSLRELGVLTGTGKGEEHLAGCLVIPLYDYTSRLVGLVGYPLEGGEVRFAGEHGALFNWQAMKNHSEVQLVKDPLKALVRIAKRDEAVIAWSRTNGPN